MNQAVAIDAIEERLRAFVLDNDLSRDARIQAERYLARLTSPVRVTLFGRPRTGGPFPLGITGAHVLDVQGRPELTVTRVMVSPC